MFQNPRLLPWRTVYQNLALVLDGGAEADARIATLLEAVGLTAVRDQYPGRLSVGMARRAALARAFVVQPDLLLMDEPFVSLDEPTAQRLRALLLDVWNARPTTVLFVTHNLREAIQLADRLVLLSAAPTRVLADLPVDLPRDHAERRSRRRGVPRGTAEQGGTRLPAAGLELRALDLAGPDLAGVPAMG